MHAYTWIYVCSFVSVCNKWNRGCARGWRLYRRQRVAKTHRVPEVACHFRQRATTYRALLRKMTCKDNTSYVSSKQEIARVLNSLNPLYICEYTYTYTYVKICARIHRCGRHTPIYLHIYVGTDGDGDARICLYIYNICEHIYTYK